MASERDLEKYAEVEVLVTDYRGKFINFENAIPLMKDISKLLDERLAAERASLPESVVDALSSYNRLIGMCIRNGVLDDCISKHAKQALADLRRWQQGEGPEPREDV